MSRIERVEHLLQSIEYETKAAFDEHTELLNENERLNAENAKLMEENAKLRKFCAMSGYPHTLRPELHKALEDAGIDYWVASGLTFWNCEDGRE